MRAVLIAILALAIGALAAGAPAPFAKPWPRLPVSRIQLDLVEAKDTRKGDWRGVAFDLVLRTTSGNPERLMLVKPSWKCDFESDDIPPAYRGRWGVLTLIARFPDGTVVEDMAVSPFESDGWEDTGSPFMMLEPGKPLSFPLRFAWLGETEENLARWKRFNGRLAVTAVIASLGLQSNTLLVNGCPKPPATYRPLDHSMWLPEVQRARHLSWKAKDEEARAGR